MRLRSLLATSVLLFQAVASASLDSAARQLATATGGLVQACPPGYPQGVCVRVEGGVVKAAGKIEAVLPALVPGLWRDGPEQGMAGDVPGENAVLNLLPRGEEQTLAVFQPKGAAAPKVTPPSSETGVVIENPENNYVVILDSSNRPVRDLTALRDGTYTVITSNYGRRTQSQTLKVGSDGLKKVSVPRLVAATPNPTAVRLVLPTAPGYFFLVFSASGALVTDASVLQSGYYDVFSYRNGEEGPLAGSQFLQVGQLTTLKFNGTFAGTTPQPATVQSPTPSAAPSTGGRCYVSGYTRKNGTYVGGYFRSC